ncbi:riboflavin biosynthesis protein [Methylococcaceae bacterium]|jgi:riboflavin kinase / FMN adenylyltransferase|nr:riboflavin biosynthesis protein [Methylococcaceae bacterium]
MIRLIRGFSHPPPFLNGCVLTIGNFDGVHLGHRAVIEMLAARGRELNLPTVIMLFEPQPLEYFLADNAPSRLMRLREKILALNKLSVDNVVIVRFNRALANLEPEQFIEKILVEKLNVKHLVIGDDFHFGKMRRGNFNLLKEQGELFRFSVEKSTSYLLSDLRVSSTLIRDALNADDLIEAQRLLGYDYSICGRVAQGDKIGRTLGFPTANIKMLRRNTPIRGVFAVTMTGIDNREFQGVANVGTRPTIDGNRKVILETHLFNFDQNIYGHYVSVQFKHKLRQEMRFNSLDQLQTQIRHDVAAAKEFFNV